MKVLSVKSFNNKFYVMVVVESMVSEFIGDTVREAMVNARAHYSL